jgi:hypothetical protein
MADLQTEEPVWVQQMRAAGYNIRVGTSDAPLNEEPDAVFYPPPYTPLSGIRARVAKFAGFLRRVLRLDASARRARHAPFP